MTEPADGNDKDATLKLEYAKLKQDRELREKELDLKGKELDQQAQQSRPSWWSAPLVLAIVAGFVGYLGTLVSSHATLQLEREKQEASLILEAIRTSGTAADREKQVAANLVFFADAGLITSIQKAELDKLRTKSQGAGPLLPAAKNVGEFEPSITGPLQTKLQAALTDYKSYLTQIGYAPDQAKDPVTVRIDETASGNAYFDGKSVVLGPNLASDPEYMLSEYTWYVLKESNPKTFQLLWTGATTQAQGFSQGLKFYFTCSYLNEPYVGRSFYALSGIPAPSPNQSYIFNLDGFKAFKNTVDDREPHKLGEIWGGALWELRKKFGRDKTDRLVFAAWKQLKADPAKLSDPKFYVETIVDAARATGNAQDSEAIRQAFARRNLK